MNIFVLDRQPHLAARYHCDKHVVKMCLEYAQILCTVAHSRGYQSGYMPTHAHHPCVLWANRTDDNIYWLADLLAELGEQYEDRYGREHASVAVGLAAYRYVSRDWKLPKSHKMRVTPFAQAMPDKYRNADAVRAYRAYYIGEKADFATWRNGAPKWWR